MKMNRLSISLLAILLLAFFSSGIFLDYGEKEEFEHIRIGVKLLSTTLSEMNIPHRFEVYAKGTHGSLIRQRMETRVLPFFN